jgi:tRNA A37 threonylcarbamoyladenosine synthetase subunit TsaC/SUA5/YrdC
MTEAWRIDEALGGAVDAVIDAGECGREPTTVVDLTGREAVVRRVGAGDPERFE